MGAQTSRSGFTIVELLIVIVVIAILAAITIVAYNGIQDQAEMSRVNADFSQATRLIEAERSRSATAIYPDSPPLQLSRGGFDYLQRSSGEGYCLVKDYDGESYFVTSAQPHPLPGACSDLVFWVSFNGSVDDISGYRRESSVNGVAFTADRDGLAQRSGSFNGASSYVNYENLAQLPTGSSSRSVCGWGRLESTAGYGWILSYGTNAHASGVFIGHGLGTTAGQAGGFGGTNVIGGAGFWALNEWQHMCMTYSGSAVSIYINGTLYAAGSMNWNTVPSMMHIGKQLLSEEYWHGQLDDVRMYSVALSPSEVQQLYEAGPF